MCLELYDEVFEIIDCFTFTCRSISQNMWQVFDFICNSFKTIGIDYIDEMLPSLDNFVSYGGQTFMQNSAMLHKLAEIVDLIMKSDRVGEHDRVNACKLMESMLLHLRGGMDQYFEHFIELVGTELASEKVQTTQLRMYLLEILINCIVYNTGMFFQITEKRGMTAFFMQMWFENMDKFKRVHDKKLQTMALCNILEAPEEVLPESICKNLADVLKAQLQVLQGFQAAVKSIYFCAHCYRP